MRRLIVPLAAPLVAFVVPFCVEAGPYQPSTSHQPYYQEQYPESPHPYQYQYPDQQQYYYPNQPSQQQEDDLADRRENLYEYNLYDRQQNERDNNRRQQYYYYQDGYQNSPQMQNQQQTQTNRSYYFNPRRDD